MRRRPARAPAPPWTRARSGSTPGSRPARRAGARPRGATRPRRRRAPRRDRPRRRRRASRRRPRPPCAQKRGRETGAADLVHVQGGTRAAAVLVGVDRAQGPDARERAAVDLGPHLTLEGRVAVDAAHGWPGRQAPSCSRSSSPFQTRSGVAATVKSVSRTISLSRSRGGPLSAGPGKSIAQKYNVGLYSVQRPRGNDEAPERIHRERADRAGLGDAARHPNRRRFPPRREDRADRRGGRLQGRNEGPRRAQMSISYQGTARLASVDEANRTVDLEVRAKEAKGQGTAAAVIHNQVVEEGGATRVIAVTDLQVTGRQAQFGRGIMQDVAGRMLTDFAQRFEAYLLEGGENGAAATAEPEAAAAAADGDAPAPPSRPTPPPPPARRRGGRARPRLRRRPDAGRALRRARRGPAGGARHRLRRPALPPRQAARRDRALRDQAANRRTSTARSARRRGGVQQVLLADRDTCPPRPRRAARTSAPGCPPR